MIFDVTNIQLTESSDDIEHLSAIKHFLVKVCTLFWGFPGGSAGKESACNVGDLGAIPGLGRYPGEGNSYPLQYSGLENSMDCIVHGVAESDTTEPFSLHIVFKTMLQHTQ